MTVKTYEEDKKKITQVDNITSLLYRYRYEKYGSKRYKYAIKTIFGLPLDGDGDKDLEPEVDPSNRLLWTRKRILNDLEIDLSNKPLMIGIIPEANDIMTHVQSLDMEGDILAPRLRFEKHLTKEQWVQLTTRLAADIGKRFPDRAVQFCFYLNPTRSAENIISPLEDSEEQMKQLIHGANPNAKSAFLRLSNLYSLGHMLELMDVTVGNDTGPTHYAAAVKNGGRVVVAFTDYYNENGLRTSDLWTSSQRMKGVAGNHTDPTAIKPVSETIDINEVIKTAEETLFAA